MKQINLSNKLFQTRMPKLCVKSVSDDITIGIWKISETVEDFFRDYPFLCVFRKELSERYHCDARKCEFLSVRALLYLMCPGRIIRYHSDGSPYLDDMQCSISHTKGYATLILSSIRMVGIDIEYHSGRVAKIKDKFIRQDEVAETTASMLIHWSAKEAVYKLFHEDNLKYFDMKISPFTVYDEGDIFVENLVRDVTQSVHYIINDNYVLTYCVR